MFTGIVREVGTIASVKPGSLAIKAREILKGMELGESIAVNGVCLTVTSFDANSFSADVMQETRKRSNLGQLSAGDRVNLEPALALGGSMGGHLVQGHIDATGKLTSIKKEGDAILLDFEAGPEVMRYVVEKGFIAVDGISLTVVNRTPGSFRVSVVDFTRNNTTLIDRKAGDTVNLEVDIIAKYVEQLSQAKSTGITAEFLQKQGF